jgi:hypothetical protein
VTENCESTRKSLGLGGPLSGDQGQHVSKCSDCSELVAGFGALDLLMEADPVPLAPADLVSRVMVTIRGWRQAELRAIRLQVGLAVAAALLLAVMGSLGLPAESGADAWVPDLQAALTYTQALIADVQLSLDVALGQGLEAMPSPPLLLIALVVPFLLISNWSLCRGRLQGRLL